MKVTRWSMMVFAAALVVAAASARAGAPPILIKAAVKATTFESSNGKIAKRPTTNATLIQDCEAPAGSQVVGVFDTISRELVALEVVDSCGNVQCQIATLDLEGVCEDTGIVGSSEESVCPVSFSLIGGGGGHLICDLKLSLDGEGGIQKGTDKCSGVFVDGSGHPGTISITAGALFKPAGNCPQ